MDESLTEDFISSEAEQSIKSADRMPQNLEAEIYFNLVKEYESLRR